MAQVGREPSEFQVMGTQQTPIDIVTGQTVPVKFGKFHIDYGYTGKLPGVYKDDNFVFDAPTGNEAAYTIKVGGTPWLIRKIHIHNKAEHTLDGAQARDFECHLLHSAPNDPEAAGDKLVVGVFFRLEQGAPTKVALSFLNSELKAGKGKVSNQPNCANLIGEVDQPNHANLRGELDPREFLPLDENARADWFHYMGSLTTKPFSETVSWYVIGDEIPVDPSDIDQVQQLAKQHQRPLFPLNRRFVLRNDFDESESRGQGNQASQSDEV